MPVTGAIPIVIPTLTKTWNRNANTIPPATIAREEVARDRDDLEAAPDDEQVEQEQDRRAEEAALLGERREDEVGRVLGQVVEARLRRAVDAAAVEAAGADRGDRLGDVVGRAARVLVGMREAGQPRLLVRLRARRRPLPAAPEHGERRRSAPTAASTARCSQRDAGDEQHRRERGRVDERRADVRLDEDEQRSARARARSPASTRPQLADPPRAVGEEAGEGEHEQQLPELGRLELEEADVDPALRAARRLGERRSTSTISATVPT